MIWNISAVYTQGTDFVPRGLCLESVGPICTSHLQRQYWGQTGCNRELGAPQGLGPGRVSARAWDPSHHPSQGAGQWWGQAGQPSTPQNLWDRDWWPWAGLERGSGPRWMCGMKSLHWGIQIPHLKDFPDLEERWWGEQQQVSSSSAVSASCSQCIADNTLPGPEGYITVPPLFSAQNR